MMQPSGKFFLVAGLTAAALSCQLGCGRGEPGMTNWPAAPLSPGAGDVTFYRDVGFADMPVPEGYELLSRESHSFQGSQSRSGVFHYQGGVDWLLAADFFRTQLPAAGWSPASSGRGPNFRELRFRKGQEQLIVVVRRARGGSLAEIQLDNPERSDLLLKGKLPGPRPAGS